MGSDLKQQGESFHISMHCYLTEIKRIKKENRKMKKKKKRKVQRKKSNQFVLLDIALLWECRRIQ